MLHVVLPGGFGAEIEIAEPAAVAAPRPVGPRADDQVERSPGTLPQNGFVEVPGPVAILGVERAAHDQHRGTDVVAGPARIARTPPLVVVGMSGDQKEVFLYHDSEDRLVATTETPLLREGEAGYLRVVDKTAHGAFLDWGLHGKDLFLPNRNQQGGILAGHSYIVYLYEDNITGRCVATTKLKSFINNDLISVKPRQEVALLVASESEIGFRVIVENRHWGMIYRNQIFRPVAVGDRMKGYVRRITEDNRIDVSLQQTGFAQVKDSAEELLQLVRDNGGFLPLNDDSSPEEVTRLTGTSKKVFKRSLGMLLKRGAVEAGEKGIKIRKHGED